MTEWTMPEGLEDVLPLLTMAKNRGMSVRCCKCKQPATLALACETGEFQGVACEACFATHLEYIESAQIFVASGLAETAWCSRCGVETTSDNHIITERI